jgi:dienelactone hydrolase
MKTSTLILLTTALAAVVMISCQSGAEKKNVQTDSLLTPKATMEKIEFPSLDKLPVSANLRYSTENTAGFIVLCHMAGYNKSEYRDIAAELFEEGYNTLAIDQRSGGSTSGFENETFNRAVLRDKATGFLDAEQDMIAAVNYVNKTYDVPVILWGSSYSASLALKIGKENEKVKAVIAFSPGEYFSEDSLRIRNYIDNIGKPVFITSSRDEVNDELIGLIDALGPKYVTHYRPKGKGEHGSMSLWNDVPENLEYWKAVKDFLRKL